MDFSHSVFDEKKLIAAEFIERIELDGNHVNIIWKADGAAQLRALHRALSQSAPIFYHATNIRIKGRHTICAPCHEQQERRISMKNRILSVRLSEDERNDQRGDEPAVPDIILIRNQYPDAAALHRVLDYVCRSEE